MNPRTSLDTIQSYSKEPLPWFRGLQDGKAERETLFVLRFYVHTFLGGNSGET